MKMLQRWLQRCVFLAALAMPSLAGLLFAAPAAAITVSVRPADHPLDEGGLLAVELWIEGLGDAAAPSLGSFDLTLGFDPAILAIDAVTFGDPSWGDQLDLAGLGSFSDLVLGVGSVNLFEVSFDDPAQLDAQQRTSFVLATVVVRGIGLGQTVLAVDPASLTLGDALGQPLDADLVSGRVEVLPIPEPPMALLWLAGIGVMAGRLRSRAPRQALPA